MTILFSISRDLFRSVDEEASFKDLLQSLGIDLRVVSIATTPNALVVKVETSIDADYFGQFLQDLGYPVKIISHQKLPPRSSATSGVIQSPAASATPPLKPVRQLVTEPRVRADSPSVENAIRVSSGKLNERENNLKPKKFDVSEQPPLIPSQEPREASRAPASPLPPTRPPPVSFEPESAAKPPAKKASEKTSVPPSLPPLLPEKKQFMRSGNDIISPLHDSERAADIPVPEAERLMPFPPQIQSSNFGENMDGSRNDTKTEGSAGDVYDRSNEYHAEDSAEDNNGIKQIRVLSLVAFSSFLIVGLVGLFLFRTELSDKYRDWSGADKVENINENTIAGGVGIADKVMGEVSDPSDPSSPQPITAPRKSSSTTVKVSPNTAQADNVARTQTPANNSKRKQFLDEEKPSGQESSLVNDKKNNQRSDNDQLDAAVETEIDQREKVNSVTPKLTIISAEVDIAKTIPFAEFRNRRLRSDIAIRRGRVSESEYDFKAPLEFRLCITTDGSVESFSMTFSGGNSKRLIRLAERWIERSSWRWKGGTPSSTRCDIPLTLS